MKTIKITLPIYWVNKKVKSKSTTHLVSLNFFRNAHYHIQNKMKQDFHSLVLNQVQLTDKPLLLYKLHTDLYYKNPSCDGTNIVPMVEKFLLDALQEAKIVTNDNVKCNLSGEWSVVAQDKINPRVEITLIPIGKL